jgi:hypothetical protein
MKKKVRRESSGCEVGVKASNDLALSKATNAFQFVREKLVTLALNGELQGKTIVLKLEVS